MKKKSIIRYQLDNKIIKYANLLDVVVPPTGWIYSIRQAINMSLRQLGLRLSITPQSVKEIEEREKNGTISIKVLKQVAHSLNMKFVYGFIPMEKTLEKMIEKRAEELAREIVQRTSVQMGLEDQLNTPERIEKAIKEKTEELKNDMPKILWD
ncbi:MAG: mobile mystery protein A [Bacteroidales bacterium]|nr:mobile mystery protein A [Bacteroidales bacterium]MCF8389072.1 mobile mystery protein A [Bacteroidales bacterium]